VGRAGRPHRHLRRVITAERGQAEGEPVRPGDRAAAAAPNLTPPPGNPRFPLFDSLRAIAALCVFAGHTVSGTVAPARHPYLVQLASQVAYEGVAIFFLLSGFLLYRPFLTARASGRAVSLVGYTRRRVLRIVPAYWVALTVCLVFGFVGGVSTGNWWVFYGFGQTYSFSTIGSGIGAAWTLCVEASFYVALPLFALVADRLGGRGRSLRGDVGLLLVLAAASLAFRQHFSSFADLATASTLPGMFFWFALGMGLAIASVTERGPAAMARLTRSRSLGGWPSLSWIVAVGLFGAAHELQAKATLTPESAATHVLYGLAAFFLLLPAVFDDQAGGLVRRFLGLPALAWIGLISYSFYLYHTIVIAQLDQLAVDHDLPLRYLIVTVAALPISLACAAASFYLLERPLMRLGSRRRAG
jgi:peptidoglycan/LPS O-acetylase OafA/YrhL